MLGRAPATRANGPDGQGAQEGRTPMETMDRRTFLGMQMGALGMAAMAAPVASALAAESPEGEAAPTPAAGEGLP